MLTNKIRRNALSQRSCKRALLNFLEAHAGIWSNGNSTEALSTSRRPDPSSSSSHCKTCLTKTAPYERDGNSGCLSGRTTAACSDLSFSVGYGRTPVMFWMRRPLSSWQVWNYRRSCSANPEQEPHQSPHEMRFREALSRAGDKLEYSDAHLKETLREFETGVLGPYAVSSTDVLYPILKERGLKGLLDDSVRDLFYGTASRHREVGTLTHLFTRIRRKGVSPLEPTESVRTNQRRLISLAQMHQIAQELHDGVVTTTPDHRANVKAIDSMNNLNTLLSDAFFAMSFKTVADIADIRVLELFSRSLERFSSSYFDDEEKTDAADSTAIIQQWSRYQARNTEPLANAFECWQLLAGANAEELSAARQCGNDLALAIQSQRERRDIVDGMSGVIRGLTDGVLGYLADCEASEACEALRNIAYALRNA
ncbi:uncharacterized protein LOC142581874 [Dermacentor variabilis]|uniref:uncharacterized protein LOC142581874 n=1 Tax=Dermacentor variabilis TaxID=34621 RepID=UPI003F5C3EF2